MSVHAGRRRGRVGRGPAARGTPDLLIAAEPTGERYPSVALVVGRVAGGAPWGAACTGTLVAPAAVLTAGHCMALSILFEGRTEFGVTFDPVFTPASRVIRVTARVHPDYAFRFPFPAADDPVVVTTPNPAVGGTSDSGGPLLLGPADANRGPRGVTMDLGVAAVTDCATCTTFYRVDTPPARAILGAYLELPGGGTN